jgi:hypothetical protein
MAGSYGSPAGAAVVSWPLDVTQTLARCLNVVFTLQGLRYNTAVIIGQRLEAARQDWQQLLAAHQQLNFTLTQMQQENDRQYAQGDSS